MAKEEFQDPSVVAEQAHLLMSHRNDLVRLWNAGPMNSYYTESPDGKKALVQIVNYSSREKGDTATVWIRDPYRSARLWTLEKGEPVTLKGVSEGGGQEFHLPPFQVFAAIELEK